MPDDDLPVYELQMSEPAEMEIDGIYLNMIRFGLDAAQRWLTGFYDAIARLETLPRAFPIAKESEVMGKNVRVMLYGKGRSAYRVLYAVFEPSDGDPGIVRIVRVLHAMRRPYGEDED